MSSLGRPLIIGGYIQSVVFKKALYTPLQAEAWLRAHHYKHTEVDTKKNTLR